MATTRRFGALIAERRLSVLGTRKVVRVSIGAPRPEVDGAPWACPFRISGAGISRVEHGCGEDSMQALTTALEFIRTVLDETGLPLGWNLGGFVWDGETGFARSIPYSFGPTVRRRLERLVDREVTRDVQGKRRLAARRRGKTATTP
jgi:hypothetical protein